jgi:DNA repair protein SbcD/Mre11
MKIIHFSDTHIGVDSVGGVDPDTGINSRVLDYLDSLDAIVDFAYEEKVDLVIFTGDAFHVANPNSTYLNEFAKRMVRLRRQCPLILLIGNHDMTRRNAVSTVEIYNSLQIEGIIVGNVIATHFIDTKAGRVQVVTVPYPSKKTAEEISNILKEVTESLDPKLPSIFMGHFSVQNAFAGSESDYSMSASAEVALEDIAKPIYDYVALGHIHKHQNLTTSAGKNIPPVVYAGSIERVTFNEEREAKGFVLVEIINKQTTWEFVDLDSRAYKTVEIVCEEGNATKQMLSKISKMDLKGAVVRYIIHVTEDCTNTINESIIIDALYQAGVFAITSKKIDVVRTARDSARSSGFSVISKPEDLLSRYFDLLDIDKKSKIALKDMAIEIMRDAE